MNRILVLLPLFLISSFLSPARKPAHAATSMRQPFPVTVVDDQGNHVRFTHAPRRIVTLYADDTEILFALGVERLVVGDGSKYAEGATGITDAAGKPRSFRYPAEWPTKLGRNYPTRSLQLPHVEGGTGATSQFNLETIVSLHPDLVVAPYYKSQEPTYGKLRDLGLHLLFLNPSNVAGVFHDIVLLGTITGTRGGAVRLVHTLQSQLRSLRAKLSRVKHRVRVYYELDASNPVQPYTAGPGTPIDEAIKIDAGRNIADTVTSCNSTNCYPQFSLEALVQLDPEIIVLADAAYGTKPEDVKARAGWEGINAVRHGRIYPINPDVLSRFGPRIVIGYTMLARLLHPESFHRARV